MFNVQSSKFKAKVPTPHISYFAVQYGPFRPAKWLRLHAEMRHIAMQWESLSKRNRPREPHSESLLCPFQKKGEQPRGQLSLPSFGGAGGGLSSFWGFHLCLS